MPLFLHFLTLGLSNPAECGAMILLKRWKPHTQQHDVTWQRGKVQRQDENPKL